MYSPQAHAPHSRAPTTQCKLCTRPQHTRVSLSCSVGDSLCPEARSGAPKRAQVRHLLPESSVRARSRAPSAAGLVRVAPCAPGTPPRLVPDLLFALGRMRAVALDCICARSCRRMQWASRAAASGARSVLCSGPEARAHLGAEMRVCWVLPLPTAQMRRATKPRLRCQRCSRK